MEKLNEWYKTVRDYSLSICASLEPEDYICQPEAFVSPPKWHLAHTTWFFEEFILKQSLPAYKPFHPWFHFLFNSYYETAGTHLLRNRRGTLSRPSIQIIMEYRKYVDAQMESLLNEHKDDALYNLVVLGLHHEQQHQELLLMDIKYIFGCNPMSPHYTFSGLPQRLFAGRSSALTFDGGVYTIGYEGPAFSYDNETPAHKIFLQPFSIASDLVSNGEYLEFIEDKGYQRVDLWHSDGWEWVKQNELEGPLYWQKVDGLWCTYDFKGLNRVAEDEPVMHVSYYEASAFAAWKGKRLPTEFEWEISASHFVWGKLWEHTLSAYLPYPGYKRPAGTIGEYNAKFMVNQMVLRGASFATPPGHQRLTYRNFFQPHMQWQFSGIRLAQSL